MTETSVVKSRLSVPYRANFYYYYHYHYYYYYYYYYYYSARS